MLGTGAAVNASAGADARRLGPGTGVLSVMVGAGSVEGLDEREDGGEVAVNGGEVGEGSRGDDEVDREQGVEGVVGAVDAVEAMGEGILVR